MCGYCSIICTMELPTSHTKIPFSFRYSAYCSCGKSRKRSERIGKTCCSRP
ncbi:Uncharacterised protein [Vibrio cholerae]|nr:Uncharacterised protein [Vibrio cholerae]